MPSNERQKELKQRRRRRDKLTKLKGRLAKASQSEKEEISRKLRNMTPGAEQVIGDWKLQEADR